MALEYRSYCLSKGAGGSHAYEDALAADPDAGRFAVADGATGSAFADTWAQLLVQRFAASAEADLAPWDPSWIGAARDSWQEEVRWQLTMEFGDSEPPWYVADGQRQGAFATFLGLVIESDEDHYRWRATAVGDSCLFHTRDGDLLCPFPIKHTKEFSNYPPLLASSAESAVAQGRSSEGTGQPNDRLWLATDALAEWCLAEEEAGRGPWQSLEWLLEPAGTDQRFASWIERLRNEERLKNDDVTLVIVAL
jgi:hypothetical protein